MYGGVLAEVTKWSKLKALSMEKYEGGISPLILPLSSKPGERRCLDADVELDDHGVHGETRCGTRC